MAFGPIISFLKKIYVALRAFIVGGFIRRPLDKKIPPLVKIETVSTKPYMVIIDGGLDWRTIIRECIEREIYVNVRDLRELAIAQKEFNAPGPAKEHFSRGGSYAHERLYIDFDHPYDLIMEIYLPGKKQTILTNIEETATDLFWADNLDERRPYIKRLVRLYLELEAYKFFEYNITLEQYGLMQQNYETFQRKKIDCKPGNIYFYPIQAFPGEFDDVFWADID